MSGSGEFAPAQKQGNRLQPVIRKNALPNTNRCAGYLYAARGAEKLRGDTSIAVYLGVRRTSPFARLTSRITAMRVSEASHTTHDSRDIINLLGVKCWTKSGRMGTATKRLALCSRFLLAPGVSQLNLFDDNAHVLAARKLMEVLDQLNAKKAGRGTLCTSPGRAFAQQWAMKREMLSPRYTIPVLLIYCLSSRYTSSARS